MRHVKKICDNGEAVDQQVQEISKEEETQNDTRNYQREDRKRVGEKILQTERKRKVGEI